MMAGSWALRSGSSRRAAKWRSRRGRLFLSTAATYRRRARKPSPDTAQEEFVLDASRGRPVRIEKIAALFRVPR